MRTPANRQKHYACLRRFRPGRSLFETCIKNARPSASSTAERTANGLSAMPKPRFAVSGRPGGCTEQNRAQNPKLSHDAAARSLVRLGYGWPTPSQRLSNPARTAAKSCTQSMQAADSHGVTCHEIPRIFSARRRYSATRTACVKSRILNLRIEAKVSVAKESRCGPCIASLHAILEDVSLHGRSFAPVGQGREGLRTSRQLINQPPIRLAGRRVGQGKRFTIQARLSFPPASTNFAPRCSRSARAFRGRRRLVRFSDIADTIAVGLILDIKL